MEDLWARFQRWRSAVEGEGLKVNIGKTKMMVSGAENAIALSKMKPRGICGKRVVSNAEQLRWPSGMERLSFEL